MQQNKNTKVFGLWSAIFLGIGSMVGAGIFIVIGEAGTIAGNLVTLPFIIAGLIALVCGYSLSKLAVHYPSRGGIIEYLVHGMARIYFQPLAMVFFRYKLNLNMGVKLKLMPMPLPLNYHEYKTNYRRRAFCNGVINHS